MADRGRPKEIGCGWLDSHSPPPGGIAAAAGGRFERRGEIESVREEVRDREPLPKCF